MSAPAQPRDRLGRFAEYPTGPIPLGEILAELELARRPDGGWTVPAPRCPHGHFARWAARNCTPCRR